MCGRYTLAASREAVIEGFKVVVRPEILRPRWNVAPSQPAAVVLEEAGAGRRLDFFLWGLVPSWAKDPKIAHKLINARSETAAEKPSFRAALRYRRCLVLADGFYEWGPPGPEKRPHLFGMRGGGPFGLAGLWERWLDATGTEILSCCILTCAPNDLVRPVHDRMPVVVPAADHARWLDPEIQKPAEVADLLAPYPAADMEGWPVSTLVNSPAVDEPACAQPAG